MCAIFLACMLANGLSDHRLLENTVIIIVVVVITGCTIYKNRLDKHWEDMDVTSCIA